MSIINSNNNNNNNNGNDNNSTIYVSSSREDMAEYLKRTKGKVSDLIIFTNLLINHDNALVSHVDYLSNIEYKRMYLSVMENYNKSYKFSGISFKISKITKLFWLAALEEKDNNTTKLDVSNDTCAICMINKSIICLEYCGHVCMCATCMKYTLRYTIKNSQLVCPICRHTDVNFIIIHK